MTDININRTNLLNMMALTEDITRTNNRLYDLLSNLINNPEGIPTVKNAVKTLCDKIELLKKSDIGVPLIEEESVLVPGPNDVSPKEEINFEKAYNWEETEEQPTVEKKKPSPPRKSNMPRKNTRRFNKNNVNEKRVPNKPTQPQNSDEQ